MMTNSTLLYSVRNNNGAFVGAMDVPVGSSNHSAEMPWCDAILHKVAVPVANGRKVVNQVAFDKMLERNPDKVLDFNNISFESVRFPLEMKHLFKDNIYCNCYLGDNKIETPMVIKEVPFFAESVVMA